MIRKYLYALLLISLFCMAGCGDPTSTTSSADDGSGSTPPATTVTATVEQSAFTREITGIDQGTSSEVGYLEYVWYYYSPTEIIAKAFLKFYLPSIPSGVTIESATLDIYISTYDATSSTTITQVTGAWDRTTIAATNEPTSGSNIVTKDTVLGWNKFNVTSLVRKWIAGTATNYGLIVFPNGYTSVGSNRTHFLDHDDTQYYPRLLIYYRLL